MKACLYVILILLLSLAACKDKSSSEPEETENPPLASEQIDMNGGGVEYEDLVVNVPAGSFAGSSEIKILKDESINPGIQNIYSEVYVIDGIPENYSLPIEVKLNSSAVFEGEPVVVVGEEVFSRKEGTSEFSYNLLDAVEEAGAVIAQLPVPDNGLFKSSNTLQEEIRIAVMVAARVTTYTTPQGHFKIDVEGTSISINALEALGNYLEEAYNYYQTIGFSYSARTNWPMSVTVTSSQTNYGEYSNSRWGDNYGYIEFRPTDVVNAESDPEVRRTAGHEFFHFVQSLYDPRNRFSKATGNYDWYWFDEACGTWSEEKFSDETPYQSNNFKLNTGVVLNGLQKGAEIDGRKHGYGMTSLIKYLTVQFEEEVLFDIYTKILAGKSALDAIFEETYEPKELVPQFFMAMVLGNIYNVGQGFWRSNFNEEFTISTLDDVPKTYTHSYPDFGAKTFKVPINYPGARSSQILNAEASNPDSYIIAMKSFGGGQWQMVQNGFGNISIPDVKSLNDDNAEMFFIVVNLDAGGDYKGNDDISLTINVEESEYNTCWVYIRYTLRAKSESKTDPDDVEEIDEVVYFGDLYDGTFSNNVFVGSKDSVYSDNLTVHSTVTVTFSEDLTKMISLELNDNFGYPEGSVVYTWTTASLKISNLDGEPSFFDGYEYIIEGPDVCDHLSDVSYTRETADKIITRLYDICNDNSKIEIEIYND